MALPNCGMLIFSVSSTFGWPGRTVSLHPQ